MKSIAGCVMVLVALVMGTMLPVAAGPGNTKDITKLRKQILVYAHRKGSGIEYVYDGQHYTGKQLDYLLGEWHVDAAKDSEVVVVLEDNLLLSDVKDVPAMALKAAFTDVRAFVYWKGTGNMAEVWFGPVVEVKKASAGE
jgi:hypothetical protein